MKILLTLALLLKRTMRILQERMMMLLSTELMLKSLLVMLEGSGLVGPGITLLGRCQRGRSRQLGSRSKSPVKGDRTVAWSVSLLVSVSFTARIHCNVGYIQTMEIPMCDLGLADTCQSVSRPLQLRSGH